MKKKTCFKCEEVKSLPEFYKHPAMADGYLNKCKICTRADVQKNRKQNISYYREYDRNRGNRHPKGYNKIYSTKYPNKARARRMVAYRIYKKQLFPEPCEVCGGKTSVHAHHDDYAKPLNIRWLCAAHHRQWHLANGEGKNG